MAAGAAQDGALAAAHGLSAELAWRSARGVAWRRGTGVALCAGGALGAAALAPPEELAGAPRLARGLAESELGKALLALASLCSEACELEAAFAREVLPALAAYGESGQLEEGGGAAAPPAAGALLSARLGPLARACELCARCGEVSRALVLQLGAAGSGAGGAALRSARLLSAWGALARCLELLVAADASVRCNALLCAHWREYRERAQACAAAAAADGADHPGDAGALWSAVQRLDGALLSGGRAFTALLGTLSPGLLAPDALSDMVGALQSLLRDTRAEWSVASLEAEPYPTYACEQRTVGLAALFVALCRLQPAAQAVDPALFRAVWELQQLAPVVQLGPRAQWSADEFLREHIGVLSGDAAQPSGPSSSSSAKARVVLSPRDPSAWRKEYAAKLTASLPQRCAAYVRHVSLWATQLAELPAVAPSAPAAPPPRRGLFAFVSGGGGGGGGAEASRSSHGQHANASLGSSPTARLCAQLLQLLESALALAHRVRRVLCLTLGLYQREQLPMPRRLVARHLSVCVELLKSIENELEARSGLLAQVAPVLLGAAKSEALACLRLWRSRLDQRRGRGGGTSSHGAGSVLAACEACVDLLSEALVGAQALGGARLALCRAALGVLEGAAGSPCSVEEAVTMERALHKLAFGAEWSSRLRSCCDCASMLWHAGAFLPVMLGDCVATPGAPGRAALLLQGFADAAVVLADAAGAPRGAEAPAVLALRGALLAAAHRALVLPLARAAEDALRLHQHAAHMDFLRDKALPTPQLAARLRPFLQLAPLRVLGAQLRLRAAVEAYLERQFYDLTVLALHDWRSYAEMRALARELYGLQLEDPALPQGALETGLDVLQIMRRISVFVALYNYNLHQQFFVERRADRGRSLKTINVQSIANSVGTHGLGIMNTCVNYTYQFLAKAFEVFSEFLFDENIKSYLARERRWYGAHKHEEDHRYPFARAFAYNRDIRRLGEIGGVTYLTKFRQHVAKIGNALGYVRMVRSAGMHWAAGAMQFVPDPDEPPRMAPPEGGAASASLPPEERAARETLDGVVADLARKFADETDFLKVLVEVFQQVMLGASAQHLDSFYMIVPALCVNHVEATLVAKDNIARSHKGHEAYFTDDGLAMGIAYVLAILKQNSDFNALRWFQGLRDSFKHDVRAYRDKAAKADDPTKKEELARRAQRLCAYRNEYRYLEFALKASSIFFQI
jgi:WASH complex subunit 7